MSALFNNGVGFDVYIELQKLELLFRKLMPLLEKLDWNNEGAYFNYKNYQSPNRNHVKIFVRSRQIVENEIKTILKNLQLVEKTNECVNITNYYTFFSNMAGNLSDFEDGLYLQQKEEGTKYAIEIMKELNINSQNFDQKKNEIANKIKKDKPTLINDFPAFHFVMNSLSFFKNKYIIGTYQNCSITNIEQEMINLVKNLA